MNIIYLHQYFVTPEEYGATRSYWFAKKLTEQGHQVTVISALSSSTLREKGTYNIDGIRVIYLGGRYSNLHSMFGKLLHFIRYFFAASLTLLRQKRPDLVFATSTPLTVGAIALLGKKIKRTTFVFEVRDLWPEFPIQIGAIKNPVIIKTLKWLERSIYQNALHIVALSPGMKEGIIQSGVEESKIIVIPNMSKPDIFYPREKSAEIMARFHIDPSKFNVIHFGAMGPANGLEYVVEAAKILKEEGIDDICLVFAGYGAEESKLKFFAQKHQLNNVLFTGKHNALVISELVNCCDVSLISFKNLPILATNSPNKLFDSLSAGKPIIVNSNGWTRTLAEESNCGFYVDPENRVDLVDKLIKVKNDKERLNKMGKNARRLSLEVFNKEILSEKLVTLLESLPAKK